MRFKHERIREFVRSRWKYGQATAAIAVAGIVFWYGPKAVAPVVEHELGLIGWGMIGMAASYAAAGVFILLEPDDTVVEVEVSGPIERDPDGPMTDATDAERAVGIIDAANEDDNIEGLHLRLNTPGGEPVPSDDIRRGVEEFDGPVVAECVDVCASGGYLIASACDHVVARESTLVGSIGVIGSRVNASDLADELGLSYERFAAGEYKDAGTPLDDVEEDEREYIQGIVDTHYEHFVDAVASGRDLTPTQIRDTEAKVYLGSEAADLGLVDEVGDRETAEEALQDRIETGEPFTKVRTESASSPSPFSPSVQAQKLAYAFGTGLASTIQKASFRDSFDIEFKR